MARKNNIFSSLKNTLKKVTDKFPVFPKQRKQPEPEDKKIRSKSGKKPVDIIKGVTQKLFNPKKEKPKKPRKTKKPTQPKQPKIADGVIKPHLEEHDGFIIDIDTGEIIEKLVTQETDEIIEDITEEIIEEPEVQKPKKHDRELFKEKQAEKERQKEKSRKHLEYASFSNVVINNFKGYIQGFPPNISDRIQKWLDSVISYAGVDKVAIMLEDNAEDLQQYLIQYDSETAVTEYCSALLTYLPMNDEERAEITEAFDSEDGSGWIAGEWDE